MALAEGLIRAAQIRWPEAEAAFQRAVEIDQQYELRWDEAKVDYEWSCALLRTEDWGLRTEFRGHCRDLLGKAGEMREAMGAGPWAEKCRQKLAELA